MELLILELIWWGILFFFFWALRDARGQMQADLESLALLDDGNGAKQRNGFRRPQSLREQIGRYQNQPIFRYAVADGRMYEFNRVCPLEMASAVDADELYVAPGLVYQECATGERGIPYKTS